MWIYVIPHFMQFLAELELQAAERADAENKAARVARCLWGEYYAGEFDPHCYVKVGFYGKGTASRPPSDLDMLFLLPSSEYNRTERLIGNKQSQLLQEMKRTLLTTFPNTDLRADGQVVLAPFQTYSVEIAPAFARMDGTYITAHTKDGGSWRVSNPTAEFRAIAYADSQSGNKATHLLIMLKSWKRQCSVEIKSISLEVLACLFVQQWPFRHRTFYYYDWLARDFFEFLLAFSDGWTRVPGTQEIIQLGNNWVSKCQSAHNGSLRACEYERADNDVLSTMEWQKIFGDQFRSSYAVATARLSA